MTVEYDSTRDLLYIWFNTVDVKSAQTITVAPGVYADLDTSGRLIGLEVLDAKEILGEKVQFEVSLPTFDMIKAAEIGKDDGMSIAR